MSPFIFTSAEPNLQGKTLIVPIVSTGNVSQLAVDLLITSLSLERIAILDPGYCIPVVGGREDGSIGITTPVELYGKTGSHLLVVQHRSPVLKNRKADFVTALLQFIQNSQIGSVLFLAGVNPSARADSQMSTSTYQIRPPNSPSLASSQLNALTTLPIPTYSSFVGQSRGEDGMVVADINNTIPFIPGGGLTRRILGSLPVGWSIPTGALLQFTMEGDNRADAGLFAAVVASVLGHEITEWRQPKSWKQGLFGTQHDQTLYG